MRGFDKSSNSSQSRLRLVHRLDRDVSGVLVLARTRTAASMFATAFAAGSAMSIDQRAAASSPGSAIKDDATFNSSLRKTYVAIVAAPLPTNVPRTGQVDHPIVALDDKNAPPLAASTSYSAQTFFLQKTITRSGAVLPPVLTVLYLQPMTGRKHQLRQHVLRLFGGQAAILGDSKYTPLTGLKDLHAMELTVREEIASEFVSRKQRMQTDVNSEHSAGDVHSPPRSTSTGKVTVSSRPASLTLSSQGLSRSLGMELGLLPAVNNAASLHQVLRAKGLASEGRLVVPGLWCCRHLMLHSHKIELSSDFMARLKTGKADLGAVAGVKNTHEKSVFTVRSPIPRHMRALLDLYSPA